MVDVDQLAYHAVTTSLPSVASDCCRGQSTYCTYFNFERDQNFKTKIIARRKYCLQDGTAICQHCAVGYDESEYLQKSFFIFALFILLSCLSCLHYKLNWLIVDQCLLSSQIKHTVFNFCH